MLISRSRRALWPLRMVPPCFFFDGLVACASSGESLDRTDGLGGFFLSVSLSPPLCLTLQKRETGENHVPRFIIRGEEKGRLT